MKEMSDTPETDEECRKEFEKWITSPPFERETERWGYDPRENSWPGSYKEYEVELAWTAWRDSRSQSTRESDEARREAEMARDVIDQIRISSGRTILPWEKC